mgnify:CR=1 FL=1
MASAYMTTTQVCKRFGNIASRTLKRWQDSRKFPKPVITAKGSPSMYSLDDIVKWEQQFKQADTAQ